MEVADGNVVAGANIQQTVFDPTSHMPLIFYLDWALTVEGADTDDDIEYYYINPWNDMDLYFDVDNASASSGANIKLYTFNPGLDAQRFTFIANADGTFCIQPLLSTSLVLGAVDTVTGPDNVELVSYNPSNVPNSQKWVLKRVKPSEVEYYSTNWSYFFQGANAMTCIRVSQRFSNASASSHYGLDIVHVNGTAVSGKEIYSPCEGTVVQRGFEETMGNFVIIETEDVDSNGNAFIIRLMHMQDDPKVAYGAQVDTDTLLGYVGNTGTSAGPHLHVDINNGGYKSGSQIRADLNSAINPEVFFPQILFRYGTSSNMKYAT